MDEATFQTMAAMRVVYSLPGMEKVSVRRDVLFKTVGDLRLKMDLYAPGDLIPGSTRPAVIFVSGGDASADTLRTREIGLYISYGQLVAASGFVGIVFDHRGLGSTPRGSASGPFPPGRSTACVPLSVPRRPPSDVPLLTMGE